ncbi:MAG: hypothetical protein NUV50_03450 [Rhodospirillales bacterium]|nr:hypothetical protein [Rhodospirillales bacterium]
MLKPLIYAAITALYVMQTANIPTAAVKHPATGHLVALNQR